MKRSLKQLQTWNAQRRFRLLAGWERTRAKGKRAFVWRTAFLYTFLMIPAHSYSRYFFQGEMLSLRAAVFSFDALGWLLTGLVMGVVSWSSREGQYQKALAQYTLHDDGNS
jgi:hypothetical protein